MMHLISRLKISSYKYSTGMTLLEVMVALAVFSIAAIAITKNVSEQMSNMPILEERTFAQWVAHNQMVDAHLDPEFPKVGQKTGQETLFEKDWYWRKQIVKTEDDNFRMIRISVSDTERFERIIVEVESYVHRKT